MADQASSRDNNSEHVDLIRDAIQATGGRTLYDWVAVALWDGPAGDVTVIGESPPLELKGYLHSGIWAAAHLDEATPPPSESKSLSKSGDVRAFDKGRMDVVKVGGMSIGRGTFGPGWKWSESVQPLVGTDSCELSHVGFVVSGSMRIVMDEGEEFDIKAGEAIHIGPGHDAWTLGDEPCVILEIQSAQQYGVSP